MNGHEKREPLDVSGSNEESAGCREAQPVRLQSKQQWLKSAREHPAKRRPPVLEVRLLSKRGSRQSRRCCATDQVALRSRLARLEQVAAKDMEVGEVDAPSPFTSPAHVHATIWIALIGARESRWESFAPYW